MISHISCSIGFLFGFLFCFFLQYSALYKEKYFLVFVQTQQALFPVWKQRGPW